MRHALSTRPAVVVHEQAVLKYKGTVQCRLRRVSPACVRENRGRQLIVSLTFGVGKIAFATLERKTYFIPCLWLPSPRSQFSALPADNVLPKRSLLATPTHDEMEASCIDVSTEY